MNDNTTVTRLTLDNASHDYGALAVLRNLDLTVTHGEFVVLVGPSGCGKTTLLNIIAGVEMCTRGTVMINGIDVTTLPEYKRSK